MSGRAVPALLALCILAPAARAQRPAASPPAPGGQCNFVFQSTDTTRLTSTRLPSGQRNSYIGGGVTAHCPAQSMTIISDSAEFFGDTRVLHLIGHVHYAEPRITLLAQTATYFMSEERVLAVGDVHATLPSGTTLVGPQVEYLRAVPGVRPLAHMTAPGRPTIHLVEHDSTGRPGEPMAIVANTVRMTGDSLVYAAGQVRITRTDVIATSDSAAFDSGRDWARLVHHPRIIARGSRPFTLTGRVIDLFAHGHQLDRVLSMGAARGVSRDATLTADTIDFRMAKGRLQRVFSWGPARSRAVNPTYDIVADSLDVRMPDQRMREIVAVRHAVARSLPDTARFHTTQRDWLRGDTIVAHFDTLRVAADTARQPGLVALVALGRARSYYQIAPRDSAVLQPAINYVTGRDITVSFLDHQLRQVTITDKAMGVYLEPARPPKPGAADSSKDTAPATATPAGHS